MLGPSSDLDLTTSQFFDLVEKAPSPSSQLPNSSTMEEESSEMRRQRLRALRMDADGASAPSPSSPLPRLFNPLLHDPPFSSPGIDSTPPSSRFDYYTDPMSAFSGSKRKGAFPPYNTGFSSSPVSRPPPPSPSSGNSRS